MTLWLSVFVYLAVVFLLVWNYTHSRRAALLFWSVCLVWLVTILYLGGMS